MRIGESNHSTHPWSAEDQTRLRDLHGAGKCDAEIADEMGKTRRSIVHQRHKLGMFTPAPPPPVIPEDFAEWATGKTLYQIMRRFSIGHDRAVSLRKQYGLPNLPNRTKARLDRPADFDDVAREMTIEATMRHYGRHYRVIKRWFDEAGMVPGRYVAKPRPRKSGNVSWAVRQPVDWGYTGDGSIAQAAANHLRRIGFANVYRATVLDRAVRAHLSEEGQNHYFVSGRGFMHQDDMVAMAEARGFRQAA